MEVRIPQPKEPEGLGAAAAALPVPRDEGDAPVPLSSGEDSSDEGEFEFPFVSRDSPAGTAAPADELFADGRIKTFYPVFGRGGLGLGGGGCVRAAGSHDGAARSPPAVVPRVRGKLGRLFLEETRSRNSSTSSTASSSLSAATDELDMDGLEDAAPESYCVWRPGSGSSAPASPSPRRPPRKSGSTGSMARWRRISDLVVGRSHSDGKEKFIFFATPPSHEAPNKDKPKPPKPASAGGGRKSPHVSPATEVDTVTAAAHIAYLAKGGLTGGGGGVSGGTPRRTFLPYREELVGFFANVNGVSRSHQHPF